MHKVLRTSGSATMARHFKIGKRPATSWTTANPNVPEIDPWVRLLVMEDVKLDNFYNFTFE